MTLRRQYYCKLRRDNVIPEILQNPPENNLVVSISCDSFISGDCAETNKRCKPYKFAKRDVLYSERLLRKPIILAGTNTEYPSNLQTKTDFYDGLTEKTLRAQTLTN